MIGRLKKVAVSEMYEEGGSSFTAWLRDNLDVLNEAADISLSGVREGVFPSAAGILARDGSGATVVVEHEPGESGDEGLGRLVAALAEARARAGVWIVADSRPKHVAAVSWLNETSAADLYLLKVEAFRIDDSPPAPLMTLVSGPSQGASPQANGAAPTTEVPTDEPVAVLAAGGMEVEPEADATAPLPAEVPAVAEEPVEEVWGDAVAVEEAASPDASDATGGELYRFWAELLEGAEERTRLHEGVEPGDEPVLGASAGVPGLRYNYVVGEHDAAVELRIDRDERRENDQIFYALQATEDAIAYNFGGSLDWRTEDSGARRIQHRVEVPGGYEDPGRWPEVQDAMIDAMCRLEKALRPHVSRLRV